MACDYSFENCDNPVTHLVISGCFNLHLVERRFCSKHTSEYIKQTYEHFWYCGKPECLAAGEHVEEALAHWIDSTREAILLFLNFPYSFSETFFL